MDDAGFEYLDLDAELQAALPQDGQDYLKQFGGLQASDLGSILSGTYYEGVPLDENPEAIFDVLSRESLRYREHQSHAKVGKECKTGSALIADVTSAEESDSSEIARGAAPNSPRVIGRQAERRNQNPNKRVSFHEDSPGKENEKWDSRKVQEKKSKFFPQRNEKAEKSPTKDNFHAPDHLVEKSLKKGKGLKFSGFSKLLNKRNNEKFHKHSTPRSALSDRSHSKYEEDVRGTSSDSSQVYNTIGDIDFDNDTPELDSKDYSFEDVTEIEVCYGASNIIQDVGASSSSSSSRSRATFFGRSQESNPSALYSNVPISALPQALIAHPSEVQDVVEILSTEPSQDDVTNKKRHLAMNSNILKLQEPLPSAAVGNVEKLRMFVDSLSRDTILRTVDDEGQTSLHLSVANGHLDCVILLCSKFPEMLQTESKAKLTASSLAIKAGKIEILDWLIEHTSVSKEFSSTKQRRSLVHQAAKFGQDGCLRLLLDKLQSRGTVREPRDSSGNTPAHLAAKYGHLNCLQTLVQYGRDVCLTNSSELTPFHQALDANNRTCADYLLAIHSSKELARKLAIKGALIKKYEEDRRILRKEHRELLDMTSGSKTSQSQKDLHGNLAEILDHAVTQMEDLYIENSALRQRFNGAKKGSFVLRDDVKAMLSKLKTLRQDLEGIQEVGFTSTSAAWQRLAELQRLTDDVTKSLPTSAYLDEISWNLQRMSFKKVYQEMYQPRHGKDTTKSSAVVDAPKEVNDDPSQIELYVSNENLSNGESYTNKRRRRSRTSQSKSNDIRNDLVNNSYSRGHDLTRNNDGHLNDIDDHTYHELSSMNYRDSFSLGVSRNNHDAVDPFASHYEVLPLATSDANIIEIMESALEVSIDLPNGSSDDVEDDIDAMDSVSQAGDDYRDRRQSQYSWHSSPTSMPDLTANTLVGSLVNEESSNSSLIYTSHTRYTKGLTLTKDESAKQRPGDRSYDGSRRVLTHTRISGGQAEKVFEQSEHIPRNPEDLRDKIYATEKISHEEEGGSVGFTAVLCGTDKEHISKGHEILAAQDKFLAHPESGRVTLSSKRSSPDLEDKRSSRLRNIERDTEDILMALGSNPPEDIEPTLPADGSVRIPPSMQFEMRLSTIEEASVISGSLPCDDYEEEEEEVEEEEERDEETENDEIGSKCEDNDQQEDSEGSILGEDALCANQSEGNSVNVTAATDFSGDEKPWYENSDEDDIATWRPRRHEQHGLEEHVTLL